MLTASNVAGTAAGSVNVRRAPSSASSNSDVYHPNTDNDNDNDNDDDLEEQPDAVLQHSNSEYQQLTGIVLRVCGKTEVLFGFGYKKIRTESEPSKNI